MTGKQAYLIWNEGLNDCGGLKVNQFSYTQVLQLHVRALATIEDIQKILEVDDVKDSLDSKSTDYVKE